MNQRQQFITYFFEEIATLDYTFLKFTEGTIENIDQYSDLDVLIDASSLAYIQSIVHAFEQLETVQLLSMESMCQFFIHFKDGSFLQIDCLFQLIRKNLVYLSNDYIQANTSSTKGIKTYSLECLFEHILLFHQLNNDGFPAKYLSFFGALPKNRLDEIIDFFNKKYSSLITFSELKNHDPFLKKSLRKYLNMQLSNKFFKKQINTFLYVKDAFTKLKNGRGNLITFSGVDGAGKSTILAKTKNLLEQKFRKKVIVLRHRPSMLPILSSFQYGKSGAEKRAAEKLPRQGTNKSSLSSSLRFLYYFMDYFFGQWYIFLRYQLFNYTVLYDRYYFDFIIDGKRSNIQINSRFTKFLYRFIHKPKLNIFLYAAPEVILKRKKELTAKDIRSLTAGYKDLFKKFSDKYDQTYLPINNLDMQCTLNHIQKELHNIL